ncbi:MAG: O-antigen ligase family protein [Phycisphaerae bacterium]|nr:O-antigen ligase family protein [Phycisphaerae bacterium]
MPLTTILFLVSYLFGCVGALRYPLLGVMAYLMVYFTYPTTTWWGKPLAWMGIRYAMVAAICTAVGLVLNWHRLRPGRGFWHRQEVLFVILVGAMYISMFTGAGPCETSHKTIDKMTKVLVFVLMMTHVVTDLKSYRALTWTIIVGTLYLGYVSFTAGPNSFLDGRLNDIGGPDFDRAPELGVHFVAMLPFMVAILLTRTHWCAKALVVVTAVLTCNGIVLTRTRSAMTAIVAGIVWALFRLPRRWRARATLIGLAGVVGAYSLTDRAFWERMATIPVAIQEQSEEERDEKGQITTGGRLPTWKAALNMWSANPLGVGIGNFARLIENYPPAYFPIDAHNTIVQCFAELGILGIACFGGILFVTAAQIRRIKRMLNANPRLQSLRIHVFAMETSILIFLVGGLTVSRLYCEMWWCLLALPICLERAIAQASRLPEVALEPVRKASSSAVEALARAPAPPPRLPRPLVTWRPQPAPRPSIEIPARRLPMKPPEPVAWGRLGERPNARMMSLWFDGAENLFAVGHCVDRCASFVLRCDGSGWSQVRCVEGTWLKDVWGSGSEDVYGVGDGGQESNSGVILRYDGVEWLKIHTGVNDTYQGIWGSGPNDVFAVGQDWDAVRKQWVGRIMHYDGAGWARMDCPDAPSFETVWGNGPDDVYALGQVPTPSEAERAGVAWHYDGTSWAKLDGWVVDWRQAGPEDHFATVIDGTVLHYSGMHCKEITGGKSAPALWRQDSTSFFALGAGGKILSMDASGLAVVKSDGIQGGVWWDGIWERGSGDLFVIGWDGIVHGYKHAITARTPKSPDASAHEGHGLLPGGQLPDPAF